MGTGRLRPIEPTDWHPLFDGHSPDRKRSACSRHGIAHPVHPMDAPNRRRSRIHHGTPGPGQIFNRFFYPAVPTKARPIKHGTVGSWQPPVSRPPPSRSKGRTNL